MIYHSIILAEVIVSHRKLYRRLQRVETSVKPLRVSQVSITILSARWLFSSRSAHMRLNRAADTAVGPSVCCSISYITIFSYNVAVS